MIDSVIGIVSLSVMLVALALSLVIAIRSSLKVRRLSSLIIQQGIDANHLKSKLSEALMEIESKNLEDTDGFLNFLSQSRDWAFAYIDKVGESFKELDSAMETIFQWSDTYGNSHGKSEHSEAIEEIKRAYNKFKEDMPNNQQGE